MAQVSLNTRVSVETNEMLKKYVAAKKQTDPSYSIAKAVEEAIKLLIKENDR
jgi:uncharacterized protein (DUF1778 family)